MAVLVQHVESGRVFVLIGTGYSCYKDSRPSYLGGVLFPHEEEGHYELVAVSDSRGRITWLQADEVRVLEVDGISPEKLLAEYGDQTAVKAEAQGGAGEECEQCPACGEKVGSRVRECPSCGLALILEGDPDAQKI